MNLVATDQTVEAAGAIVYWRLQGPLELEALQDVWAEQELEEKLLPYPTTNRRALYRALQSNATKRHLVRPLPGAAGYALVHEHTQQDLEYEVELKAWFENEELHFEGPGNAALESDHEMVRAVRRAYTDAKLELDADGVGIWLAHYVLPAAEAVALRPKGGVYFVPATRLSWFERVVMALTEVSDHAIYRIPALPSEQAALAVTDAMTREAETAMDTMDRELEGDITKRMANKRVKRCEAMEQKLASYEESLDSSLTALRKRVSGLRASLAAAALEADKGNDDG